MVKALFQEYIQDLYAEKHRGYAGQGGETMSGIGKFVEHPYLPTELALLEKFAASVGLPYGSDRELLGPVTANVLLNDVVYWRNIPKLVWDCTLGGYQVTNKWLSYREKRVLDRSLTPKETEYVYEMTRRIAATIFIGPKLDESYLTIKKG